LDDRIQKTTLITVYSAGVAACYLAGFWSQFDVNIFQFAGLTGFASMALYPLMTAIGLNVLAGLVVRYNSPRQASNAPDTRVSRIFKRLYRPWLTLGPFGALLALSLISDPIKWISLLLILAPWIRELADTPAVVDLIPSQNRIRVVYWLVAAPVLAVQLGATQAEEFYLGRETRVVVPTGAAKDLLWDTEHPIGYLGFAGGTYFLFESKTGNVVLINQAVAGPLALQQRPRNTLAKWLGELIHAKS
jgi:hypothetical protein